MQIYLHISTTYRLVADLRNMNKMLSKYRKHSFLIIMLVAAIITPPDLMTLILVTIP